MHRFVKDHRFPNAIALDHALAGEIRVDLEEAIAARGMASLVVSGGRTPLSLFKSLSAEVVDWSRVWITLADERWVDPTSDVSNEHLVRKHLLTGRAASAHFIGLKNPSARVADGVEWTWRALGRIARPFDVVLLGMGDDGHTASLFPVSPGLAQALDTTAPPACVAMTAPISPEARISLNMASLLDSRRVILHIVGPTKWQVYQDAQQPGPATEFPVRGILHQQQVPVDVFWSP
jgi:6-phosphogluconolactonase